MDLLSNPGADEVTGKRECPRFLLRRVDSLAFECRVQPGWFYDGRSTGEYPLIVRLLVDAAAAEHA